MARFFQGISRLAGLQDPADGTTRRAMTVVSAPAVREMGHHDVRRGSAAEVQVDRTIDEEPPWVATARSEREREAPENDGAGWGQGERSHVRRIEPFLEVRV